VCQATASSIPSTAARRRSNSPKMLSMPVSRVVHCAGFAMLPGAPVIAASPAVEV
jgi:hypothetical protein